MIDERLSYFNRYSGQIEEEEIYGGRYLRWVTTNPWGRISHWSLVKRAWFSRLVWVANETSQQSKKDPALYS